MYVTLTKHQIMNRVEHYFDRDGGIHANTGRASAPFRQMLKQGDWFEMLPSECRNPASLAVQCSKYSLELGRRFEFRTVLFDGQRRYRVTLIEDAGSVPEASPRSRQPFRVETFTRADGTVVQNTSRDEDGSPSAYPLALMDKGDWFEINGSRRDVSKAWSTACRHERRLNARFSIELPDGAYPRIIMVE